MQTHRSPHLRCGASAYVDLGYDPPPRTARSLAATVCKSHMAHCPEGPSTGDSSRRSSGSPRRRWTIRRLRHPNTLFESPMIAEIAVTLLEGIAARELCCRREDAFPRTFGRRAEEVATGSCLVHHQAQSNDNHQTPNHPVPGPCEDCASGTGGGLATLSNSLTGSENVKTTASHSSEDRTPRARNCSLLSSLSLWSVV